MEGQEYGKGVDWWAYGTVMYEMLAGLPPFYSQDVQVMYQKILTAKLTFPDNFPSDAANLLKQLLEKDPEKRLQEAKQIMSHPYFAGMDWDRLYSKQIPPPYIPLVSSATSLENISEDFVNQDVNLKDEGNISNSENAAFTGFTWKPEGNALDS